MNFDHLFDNAPGTEVRSSKLDGYGMFATRDFPAHEMVIDWSGDNFYEASATVLSEADALRGQFLCLTPEKILLPRKKTKSTFLNHSRSPNCVVDLKTRCARSSRPIKKDEEITIDYDLEPLPLAFEALLRNAQKNYR